jgi:hypothetical protein
MFGVSGSPFWNGGDDGPICAMVKQRAGRDGTWDDCVACSRSSNKPRTKTKTKKIWIWRAGRQNQHGNTHEDRHTIAVARVRPVVEERAHSVEHQVARRVRRRSLRKVPLRVMKLPSARTGLPIFESCLCCRRIIMLLILHRCRQCFCTLCDRQDGARECVQCTVAPGCVVLHGGGRCQGAERKCIQLNTHCQHIGSFFGSDSN